MQQTRRASARRASPRATWPGGSAGRAGRTPGRRRPPRSARRRAPAAGRAAPGPAGSPRGSSGSSACRCGSGGRRRRHRGRRSCESRRTWARSASRRLRAVPLPSGRAAAGQAASGAGSCVAVDRLGGEGGQADGEVLGALGGRVAHPLAGADEDRLARAHVELRAAAVLYPQGPGQHDGVLVELGSLARLRPARGRAHPGHAHPLLAVAGTAGELLDRLGRLAGRLHADRRIDQLGHGMEPSYSGGMATVAEEEYLERIYWLWEAELPITGANIARAMQVSAPTVHEMVGRLAKDGFITRRSDKSLEFTEEGRERASRIVRRHRLVERFLTDVLGVPWDEVHEEAERLEHAMSPTLEARMLSAIGDAKTCPHGHPFVEGVREPGVPLADVSEGASVRILRFENEAEDLLHYLKEEGVAPGLEGTVVHAGDGDVAVDSGGELHSVTRSVAETVSVTADPSPPPRTLLPEQLVLAKERYGR